MPTPNDASGTQGGDDPNKGGTQTPPASGKSGGSDPGGSDPSKTKPNEAAAGGGTSDGDDLGFSEKQKKYIGTLRSESASYRTKAKQLETEVGEVKGTLKKIGESLGIKEEKDPTKEDIDRLTEERNASDQRLAVRDAALEHGVSGKDGLEYFEYLVNKKVNSLKEGEELDLAGDDVKTLAQKATSLHGKGSGSTSVGSGGSNANASNGSGNPDPDAGSSGEVTVDKFSQMTTTEKSDLYTKNPSLYNQLTSQAREKRTLI